MSTTELTPPIVATRAMSLVLHTSGVAMIASCIHMTIINLRARKNWRFWFPTLFGLLLLLVTCLIEITFAAGFFDGFKAYNWGPMTTLSGDVTVRLGVLITATLRLRRLHLIVRDRNKKLVLASILCIGLFMVLSLAFVIDLRAFEYSVLGVPRSSQLRNALTYARSREGLVSFFSFFVVKVLSIGADVVFVSVLMASGRSVGKSMRKLSRTEILSPYLTNVFFSTAYLIVVALTRFPWDPVTFNYIQFTNITLSRFCPALEAFIFYQFTISQSLHLLRRKSHSVRTHSSQPGSVVATASASLCEGGSHNMTSSH